MCIPLQYNDPSHFTPIFYVLSLHIIAYNASLNGITIKFEFQNIIIIIPLL